MNLLAFSSLNQASLLLASAGAPATQHSVSAQQSYVDAAREVHTQIGQGIPLMTNEDAYQLTTRLLSGIRALPMLSNNSTSLRGGIVKDAEELINRYDRIRTIEAERPGSIVAPLTKKGFLKSLVKRKLAPEQGTDEAIQAHIDRFLTGAAFMHDVPYVDNRGHTLTVQKLDLAAVQAAYASAATPAEDETPITIMSAETDTPGQDARSQQAIPSIVPISVSDQKSLMIRDSETGAIHPSKFYELVELAEGGEAKVFKATQRDADRAVALKISTAKAFSKDEHAKNLNEIRLLSDNAPGAIQVYDAGFTAEDLPYIAMQYMNQGTIFDYLERHNLPMEELIEICEEIIYSIVQASHQRGIIHRDIKPENFLVHLLPDRTISESRNGSEPPARMRRIIKSADYGIAITPEEFDELDSGSPKYFAGTPEYMPKESFTGSPPDFRFDVFSLGTTLFELLTGKLPYPQKKGEVHTAYIVRRMGEAAPIANPKELNPQIPQWLNDIILKAIDNDPEQRFADPTDMLFAFITHEARQYEQGASTQVRQKRNTLQPQSLRELMRQDAVQRRRSEKHRLRMLRQAISKYEEAYRRFPLEAIRQKIVELTFALWQEASQRGIDEDITRTRNRLRDLLPESDARYRLADKDVNLTFIIDGGFATGVQPSFHFARALNEDGDLSNSAYSGKQHNGVFQHTLPPLGSHRLTMLAPQHIPVAIPLPPQAGDYTVRIPVYQLSQVPQWAREEHLLIPAGQVTAWREGDSYSGERDSSRLRSVDHDFMIGPLVSNQNWIDFLFKYAEIHGQKAAMLHIPRDEHGYLWHWDDGALRFLDRNNLPVETSVPVNNYHPNSIQAFIDIMRPGASLPTLDQLKLAARGVDGRKWPWGDMNPHGGEAAFQTTGESSDYVRLPIHESMIDQSPYSVFDEHGRPICQINHMIGNLERPIDVPPNHEERIFGIYKMDPEKISAEQKQAILWSFGAAYDTTPRDAEQVHRRMNFTSSHRVGLQLVYNLSGPR